MAKFGQIVFYNIQTDTRWVEYFVAECYSDAQLQHILGTKTCPIMWDEASQRTIQKNLLSFPGLRAGNTYYFRIGTVIPVTHEIQWADTSAIAVGSGATTSSGGYPECLDPRDFGAVGDDTADDTAAVQAALTQAAANATKKQGLTKVCIPSDLYCKVIASTPDGGTGDGFGACFSALFIDSKVTLQVEGQLRLGGGATGRPLVLIENKNAWLGGDSNIEIEGNGRLNTGDFAGLKPPVLVGVNGPFAEFPGNVEINPDTMGLTSEYSIPYSTLTAPNTPLMTSDSNGNVWILTYNSGDSAWELVTVAAPAGGSTWPVQNINSDVTGTGGAPQFLVFVPADNSLVLGLRNGTVIKYSIQPFAKVASVAVAATQIDSTAPADMKNAPATDGNILVYDAVTTGGTYYKFNPVTMSVVHTYNNVNAVLVTGAVGANNTSNTRVVNQYHAASNSVLISGHSGFFSTFWLYRHYLDSNSLVHIPLPNDILTGNSSLIDTSDNFAWVNYDSGGGTRSIAKVDLGTDAVVSNFQISDGSTFSNGDGPVVQDGTYLYVATGSTPNMGHFAKYRKSDLAKVGEIINTYNGILAIPDGSDLGGGNFKFGYASNMVLTNQFGNGGRIAYRFLNCEKLRVRDIDVIGGVGYVGVSNAPEILDTYFHPRGSGGYSLILDRCTNPIVRNNLIEGSANAVNLTGIADYACQNPLLEGNIIESVDFLPLVHTNMGFEVAAPAATPFFSNATFINNEVTGSGNCKIIGNADKGVVFEENTIRSGTAVGLTVGGLTDARVAGNTINGCSAGGLDKLGTLINVSIIDNLVSDNTGYDIAMPVPQGVISPIYNDGTSLVVMWNPAIDPVIYSTWPSSGSSVSYSDNETPAGTIDGINATFTLLNAPSPAASLILVKNGQVMSSGFTLTGNTIVYDSGAQPQVGDVHAVWYRY